MQVRDVMSARPVVVGPGSRREAVRRLMGGPTFTTSPSSTAAGSRACGSRRREGPLVLLGPEHVDQTFPEADAEEAMVSLIEDSEAVLVWDGGVPAGIVTAADLRRVVRQALVGGAGRHAPRPVVVVLSGEEGAGKTTLLVRTLALLRGRDLGVVNANAPQDGPSASSRASAPSTRPRPIGAAACGGPSPGCRARGWCWSRTSTGRATPRSTPARTSASSSSTPVTRPPSPAGRCAARRRW